MNDRTDRRAARRAGGRRAVRAVCALAIALPSCGDDAPKTPVVLERPELPRLRDVRERTGIDFVHPNGITPQRTMLETLGGGVAVIDYDGDGRPDLYFVGSGTVPKSTAQQSPSGSRLYRNLGGFGFEDVTARAQVGGRGYAMGAVVGDYDGDGDQDLYVTSYGSNTLYQNQGDGTFRDVTRAAGVDDVRWSTGAAFLDYDRDGDLDLFVQNYLEYSVEDHHPYSIKDVPAYPVPDMFDPVPCSLFKNRGNGTFEDVSAVSRIGAYRGKGLGVLVADFDGDGWPDIYCANDSVANFLLRNQGDGTFEDRGLVSGAAYSAEGRELAGMGVDAGDLDGDGELDIVVTNYQDEPASIYRGEGRMFYTEVSAGSGTARATLSTLGFGVRVFDLDGDSLPDIVMANGHVDPNAERLTPQAPFAQSPLCFRGLGGCRFEDVTRLQPAGFTRARVGRGLATADLDGDGDLDVVIGNLGAAPSVFENDGGNVKSWTSVLAVGKKRDSTAIGARVTVEAGGRTQFQWVRSGGSYLSQSDLRLVFGLGDSTKVDRVVVRWPDGSVDEARDVPARKHLVIVEGQGLRR
jgi:hypothetical protein